MKWLRIVLPVVVLMLGAGLVVGAAEKADKAKDAKVEKAKAKRYNVPRPFSELKDLTDAQKEKIDELVTKASAQRKELQEKLKAIDTQLATDIQGQLTDAQKAELKAAEEKAKAERAAKDAERKKAAEDKKNAEKK